MKIGIYTPYLDTLGGGEKYIFDIANCLSGENEVSIFSSEEDILKSVEERFGYDLKKTKTVDSIFNGTKSLYKSKDYDVIFFVSDGSIPTLLSKKNFLIVQFPLNWVKLSVFDKIKLSKINSIICYSEFVKAHLKKTFKKNIIVIPPYVKSYYDKKIKKENMIISVGRFTKGMNRKKQEVMVEAFKRLVDSGIKDWSLALLGSYREKDKDYFDAIKKMTDGYPIEIIGNSSIETLSEYYNKAKIYWHAAGFGEDMEKNPERAEHFGITTVEAMSAGCVPIVINQGGQREIVEDNINGFLWDTEEELIRKTENVIRDKDIFERVSKKAIKRSNDFGNEIFCTNINKLIK